MPVVETAVSTALGLVLKVVYEGGKYVYKVYKSSDLKELEETLNGLLQQVDRIREVTLESTSEPWVQQIEEYRNKFQHAQNRKRSAFFWVNRNHYKKVSKEIEQFAQNVLCPTTALNQIRLLNSSQDMNNSFSTKLESLCGLIEELANKVISKCDEKRAVDVAGQTIEISQLNPPPPMPLYMMGFEGHVEELKKIVLEDRVHVLGITAIGGAGKSALVKALCHHSEIKEYFKERIIYILVTENSGPLSVLKAMWANIVGLPEPHFKNVEHARNILALQIKSRLNEPMLVVLDDIWECSDLTEMLFTGEGYMTVVTTRDKKTIDSIEPWLNKVQYPLPPLQEEHALSFFCHCAFGKPTIPDTHDEELVKQIQRGCKGLPLALRLIGGFLNGESDTVWDAVATSIATGETGDIYQINCLLKCLGRSIAVLAPGQQQCFLDLSAFPKERNIPVNALLDIWVYAHAMSRDKAVVCLRRFNSCHLLDMKKDPRNPGTTDDCMDSCYFYLHDVVRHLALDLAEKNNKNRIRRLYMPQRQYEFSPEWATDYKDNFSEAEIVSIDTGTEVNTQWPKMEFPEAKVLLLYFTATEYCIPTILDKMTKLKVLIIHNDNAKRAKLSGFAGFQELSRLKSLHLERLIIPEECKVSESLEKISLSVCEGIGKDKMLNLPKLLKFNVDQCSDLDELSAGICSSKSLQILSITRCESLVKLPDDLGNLGSLKQMRLCRSSGLKQLPQSICNLGNLELLNISSCMGLKVNWCGRCELKETLQNVAKLPSLKKVICDEDNEQLFKISKPGLKLEGVKNPI